MGILRRTLICLVVFGLAGGLLFSQSPKGGKGGGGDVKSLLEQGLYSFEEGDFDASLAAFEKAFAQSPTADVIGGFVEKATAAKIYEMILSKDPRVAGMGRQILESSSKVYKQRLGDAEQVKRAVDETLGSESQDQLVKMIQNANTFGRNLVPALIPVLADTDLARRSVAINWIGSRIGIDAVPILQAARKHPNPTVRRNVADLLGVRQLRHQVSLATLKAMAETDASPEVKDTAVNSLSAILGDLNGRGKESGAKEYFLENAIGYYLHSHKNPFASTYYTPTVYRLEGENVLGEQVADFQLSERMAQHALEEALELDPEFHEAQVLTLCNDAAQVYEYDLNVDYHAKDDSHADVKGLLEKQKSYVDFVLRNRLVQWPDEVLFDGLGQALEDGRGDVARKIVETIRETYRGGRAPESLVKALEDSNSRLVRIAAAIALAHWNPTSRDFDAGEVVVSILSEAVVTSGVRTAHKVMGDSQQANRFAEMLADLNMESSSATDTIEKAYEVVVSSPPDVVIMDENVTKSSGKKEVAPINHFVNQLRKNYRSAGVPVVVVVPAASLQKAKPLYEDAERKVWVVPDSIDRLGLNNTVFNKIFEDKDDAKAHATRLARAAGEAINYLAMVPTRIPVRKSVESLRKVLKNRPDEVRVPCIMALGNLKAGEAVGELAVVFESSENAKEVRVEAMRAVGKALQGLSGGASPAVLKIIEGGMQSADLDLRRASWYAFSNARADPKKHLQALLARVPAMAAEPGSPPAAEVAPTEAADAAKPAAGDAEKEAAPAPEVEPAPAQEPAPAEEPAPDAEDEK